jgi:hypothetical protein
MLSAPPGSPRAWPRLGLKTSKPSRGRQRGRRARRQTLLAWAHLRASLKANLRPSDCPQGSAFTRTKHPGAHRCRDLEPWSAVRDQLSANASRHQSKSNAAEPSLLAGCWSMPDARRERLTTSHAVKGAAIAITSLPRRSPGRNGSQARLGRYAPSSGKCHVAPAVTLGANSGHQHPSWV